MKYKSLSPNLAVRDIRESLNFYINKLGFKLLMAVPSSQDTVDLELKADSDYVYAMITKDGVQLMLQEQQSFQQDVSLVEDLEIRASILLYIEVEGIEELHSELKNKELELTALKTTWYGMKEFYLKDIDGYMLAFAEKWSGKDE